MSVFQKGERSKMKGERKKSEPFKSPGSHLSRKGRGLSDFQGTELGGWEGVKKMSSSLLISLWLEAPIRAQAHHIFKTGLFFAYPCSCKVLQAAPQICAQLPAREIRGGSWIAVMVLIAEIGQANCNFPSKPFLGNCRPSIDSRFPK